MDCNPVQSLAGRQGTFAWHTTRAWVAAVFCAALVVLPVLNDVFRPHINFSILYLLPMIVCAWMGNQRLLRGILALCVVLVYAGFGVRMWYYPSPNWQWGLLNRSFVVVALIIGGYLLEVMLNNLRQRALWRPARMDAEHVIIEEIIFSSQRFVAIFSAIVVAGVIFLLDLITPGQVNAAILYSLPLLMIVWTRSHFWLWIVVGITVFLTGLGWFVGEQPTVSRSLFGYLEINRCIAATMLLGFGIIIYLATSNPYRGMESKKTAGTESPE